MSEYVVYPYYHNPLSQNHNPLSQNEWVKVVRCRDCKFSINDGMQCRRHKDSGWNGNAYCEEYAYVNPDGYCAWGESKEATEL